MGAEKRISKYNIQENLKEKKTASQKTEIHTTENLPKQSFTNDQLVKEWNTFLSEIEVKEKLVYSAINGFKVSKLEDDKIQIIYPSASAKTEFEKVSALFSQQLKQNLNHHHIQMDYQIDIKNLKVEVKTKKNVFEDFCKKNPLLGELHQHFKFDLH